MKIKARSPKPPKSLQRMVTEEEFANHTSHIMTLSIYQFWMRFEKAVDLRERDTDLLMETGRLIVLGMLEARIEKIKQYGPLSIEELDAMEWFQAEMLKRCPAPTV